MYKVQDSLQQRYMEKHDCISYNAIFIILVPPAWYAGIAEALKNFLQMAQNGTI
jgi:hypothetical protein